MPTAYPVLGGYTCTLRFRLPYLVINMVNFLWMIGDILNFLFKTVDFYCRIDKLFWLTENLFGKKSIHLFCYLLDPAGRYLVIY